MIDLFFGTFQYGGGFYLEQVISLLNRSKGTGTGDAGCNGDNRVFYIAVGVVYCRCAAWRRRFPVQFGSRYFDAVADQCAAWYRCGAAAEAAGTACISVF